MNSTPRSAALCNYTILGSEVFIIEDMLRDQRFAANPLGNGGPGVRFYAGVPIKVETGYRVGALCIADVRPRTLSSARIERLRQLGKLAEAAIDAHAQSVRAGERRGRWPRRRSSCGSATACSGRSSASARLAELR